MEDGANSKANGLMWPLFAFKMEITSTYQVCKSFWRHPLIIYKILFVGLCLELGSGCPRSCDCQQEEGLKVVYCSDQGLQEIPRDIPTDTVRLLLDHNQIAIIPNEAFCGLTMLQELDLSHNRISQINSSAFHGVTTNLRLLDLSNNLLRCLSYKAFQDIQAKVRLSENPLYCDCDLQEVLRWLEVNLENVGEMVCDPASHERFRGLSVVRILSDTKFCNRRTTDFVMLVTMFGWFAMVISYVVYYVRQNQEDTRRHLEYLKSLHSKHKSQEDVEHVTTTF
uniref:leucine-rich repeat-containing protein 3-like n=1 Tax=Myxine glutinosa TaxID=7769 RepID=UPI00358EFE6C